MNAQDCNHEYLYVSYCDANVCIKCEDHEDLTCCHCTWALSGYGNGLAELIEMTGNPY